MIKNQINYHTFRLLLRNNLLRHQQEKGYTLVVVVTGVLLLGSLLTVHALINKVDSSNQQASKNQTEGFFAAEAGLNIRAKEIRNVFEGYNRPQGTSPADWQSCVDDNSSNDGGGDFVCNTDHSFQEQTVSTFLVESPDNPTSITISPGELYAGLNAQEYRYDLNSVATATSQQFPTAILGMRFNSRLVPLFQFAAFYDKDLEILPGPPMTLEGPVHSNGDLYFNGNLTIEGQVSVVGDLYRGRKNANACAGTVNVFDPASPAPLNCDGGRTLIEDVTNWNDQIRLGIDELTLPSPDFLLPGFLYWNGADLRIVLKLDGSGDPDSIEIRELDGSVDGARTNALLNQCNVSNTAVVSEDVGDDEYENNDTEIKVGSSAAFNVGDVLTIGSDLDSNVVREINGDEVTLWRQLGHPAYQSNPVASSSDPVRQAVVSTSDTFFNYRENSYIRLLEVDLQGLLNCAHQRGLLNDGKTLDDATEGGLVFYFTVEGPNSDAINNYGIRIRNGRELRATVGGAPDIQGLTVVSDQAFYILGDYNAVNKKPASFLADSINILSNSWGLDDSQGRVYVNGLPNGPTNVSDRVASNTTINAAFLSGTDTTGGIEGAAGQDAAGQGGDYNGGLENYPRFHENWDTIPLTYRGSFVSLNTAQRVNGPWCGIGGSITNGCNIYKAPVRDWNYDTDFNNAANLPPLSPRFVFLQQEIFSREFEQ